MQQEREQEEANRLAAAVLSETTIADAERLLSKFSSSDNEHVVGVRKALGVLKDALQSGSLREIEALRLKLENALSQCMRAGVR